MYDVATTIRCPKCQAPVIEYVWHEQGVKDLPTVRLECVICGPIEPENDG